MAPAACEKGSGTTRVSRDPTPFVMSRMTRYGVNLKLSNFQDWATGLTLRDMLKKQSIK
jgi:hypothetical protein